MHFCQDELNAIINSIPVIGTWVTFTKTWILNFGRYLRRVVNQWSHSNE